MKRSGTAVLIGGLTLLCLLAGRVPLLALVVALATAGAGELFRLARARGLRPSPLIGLTGIFVLLFMAHVRGDEAPPLFPAVLAGVLGLCFVMMIGRRHRVAVTRVIAYTLLPVAWVGVPAAYLLALRGIPGGFRLVLVLIAMAVGSEAGTWLAARAEHGSSPGVVSRALLGGLVAAVAVAVVAALAVSETFSWETALVLAALVTISARAGKMAGAMIEHDLFGGRQRASDTGTSDAARAGGDGDSEAFDAHAGRRRTVRRVPAGVLRTIDGVLLSAPVFFYGFRVLAR